MERHLVKFVDRVKSGGAISEQISSEYITIRAQSADWKQRNSFTTEVGGLRENIKKNRYKDILPYDQTRVRLETLGSEFESDYINASFIQGATGNKRCIAAQGPLSHTLADFWRMLWQYDVKVIVMACKETERGKRKCERYWAARSETSSFGPFVVSNLDEVSPNEEVVVRTLQVKYQDASRTLTQFHYTSWPDHDIPHASDGILGMMDLVWEAQGTDTAPLLIHCSAGCGRTGVICTVDYVHDLLLTQGIKEDLSIMEIVTVMRTQRRSAVQTKEQYEFVYRTVAQMFQKHLQTLSGDVEEQAANCGDHYENVPVIRLQRPTQPDTASIVQPTSRRTSLPPLQPRPAQRRMNDTYAVVNKPKQRPVTFAPPVAARPPSPAVAHRYDDVEPTPLAPPVEHLYSTVRPKSHPTLSVPPAYDLAQMPGPRGAEASSAAGNGDYETVPGLFSSPSRSAKLADNHLMRKKSKDFNPTDDDYEYVSGPIMGGPAVLCSPGGMGFNCRVQKPKGPREPPLAWGRAER